MTRVTRILTGLAALAAVVYAVLSCMVLAPRGIDNIADLEAAGGGRTVVASYEGDRIRLSLVEENQNVKYSTSMSRNQRYGTASVADLAVDEAGTVYLLKDYIDPLTGKYVGQGIDVYDLSRLVAKRVKSIKLESESKVRYRWLEMSNSLALMGVSSDGSVLVRENYDPESIQKGELLLRGSRSYSIPAKEGIFEAEPVGSEMAYITMSGKIFVAGQEGQAAYELYPARVLERLMYPSFLCADGDSSLIVGEQESGDLLTVELGSGNTSTYKNGSEPFSGLNNYAPKHIVAMSMIGRENFTGVVKGTSGSYELIVSNAGSISVVSTLSGGVFRLVLRTLITALVVYLVLYLLILLGSRIVGRVVSSRSIRTKLILSTLPLLMIALIFFGFFSYQSYASSIRQSFYKQVKDEGNMLTALFGTESFSEIEFPYDYPDEAYSYLNQQMSTREIYTRTAYYENDNFYIGVDADHPCFYTMDTLMNSSVSQLYAKAAYTGVAQTGIVADSRGERLTCVTPIGGGNSTTVYLLETGIMRGNMKNYTASYIRNFLLVSVLFLAAIGILLVMAFVEILRPLRQIKEGLEEFATGNRDVRLDAETNDEFSDISRVFNKLAGDIDLQLYNLNKVSEVYYRFIPQQMLRLLGRESLGSIELGSSVQGCYTVLMAALHLGRDQNPERTQEVTNSFFNIMQDVCTASATATLMSDSANLRRLCILCPGGSQEAVSTALTAIARVDAMNATLPIQGRMDVSFVVHKADVYYGICGDQSRLIPALISRELDWLTERESLFAQISSRLIVTAEAYGDIDAENFFCRFIGTLKDGPGAGQGLYDFYDSTPPEHTRLINATRATFDKAMELYEQGRYYDAKNMFVLVLRENRFDNVARYYLFDCEQRLPSVLNAAR